MLEIRNFNYSVIIPTHNRVDLLENALKSVFNQAIIPFEIFVVDDLGQNNVRDLIKEFNKEFNYEIKYLTSNSKNGVSHSYNLGSANAKGEYLAFLDDDDFWGKNYILDVSNTFIEKNVDIVLSRLTTFDEKSKQKFPGKCPPQNYEINTFYIKNPGVLRSNLVIKRSSFNLVNGYDEKILGSSDKDLFMKLKSLNKEHYVIDKENLVFWRTNHNKQASANHKRMLGNVKNFYKKYFFSMPLVVHIKMIFKILRLVYFTMRS